MAGDNEQLAAAASCNSDVENQKPGATQNCSDIVNISVFFDGTGNNNDVDEPLQRWSNPARMWKAAQALTGLDTTNFAFYISGVGTKYNGEATTWKARNDVAVEDALLGSGAGGGGRRRIDFGDKKINDALRQTLLDNALKFNAITKAYAEKSSEAKLGDINTALKPYKLITVINLSIFGFSRGAALARAFLNNFLKNQCEIRKGGKIYFKGHLLCVRFLGLFDTVASFGLPSLNIDAPFNEKNLVVPDAVQRCVHLVAAHEIRFSFPVDLIRKGGRYRPNWTELAYPGVHSDVGGGYAPIEQGISNNYSRIPMRKMMREAVKSGVRMLNFDTMAGDRAKMFKERFIVLPETDARFAKYMAEIKPPESIEGAVAAHMKALYSGFGTMTRKKIKTPDQIATAGSTAAKYFGHIGIAKEADLLLHPVKAIVAIQGKYVSDAGVSVHQVAGLVYSQVVRPEMWRLQAWEMNCSDAVLQFVQHYVHDSKAGFLASVEPFSYFRPRGMAESSRNVLASGMDWLDDTATAAKEGTFRIIHSTGVVIVETWEEGVLIATRKYKVGEKFVLEKAKAGITYQIEVIQAGTEVVISTMTSAGRWVVTSATAAKKKTGEFADATQKKAGEFADATQKKAGELADATQKKAGEFADAVQKKSGEFADSAGKTATEVGKQVKSGASSVARGAGQAVDAGVTAVENTWTSAKSAFGF